MPDIQVEITQVVSVPPEAARVLIANFIDYAGNKEIVLVDQSDEDVPGDVNDTQRDELIDGFTKAFSTGGPLR